jgi:aspartate kinase
VIRRRIPIRIKNVEKPNGRGTVIQPEPEASSTPPSPDLEALVLQGASLTALAELSAEADEHRRRKRLPTAVTIKERILVLNVNSNRKSVSHGFLARIFGTLDRFGVVVDLISTSEVHVSMAIEDGLGKKVLDRLVRELEKNSSVSISYSLLSLWRVLTVALHLGLRAPRYGNSLASGSSDAEHGRHSRKNVLHPCGGEHQHRDD